MQHQLAPPYSCPWSSMESGGSPPFTTTIGAKTTALIEPDRLYVFSASHGGILDLKEA